MHWLHFILYEIVPFLILGMVAGTLSGLLGAGGGLVIVPGLLMIFRYQGLNPAVLMHIAVATSLATMIPVAFRSLTAHMRMHVKFFAIYRKMAPGIVVGVIGGGILAHRIHSTVLQIIFGIFVLFMAVFLLIDTKPSTSRELPGSLCMLTAGGLVGIQSGLLGVAGSAFSVPFLTYRGVDMRVAVVVSVAIAMTVSVLGAATFIVTGMHATGLPPLSTGYVYWPAWVCIVIGGILMAPVGASLSHRISSRMLKRYFALFLLVVAAHMLCP